MAFGINHVHLKTKDPKKTADWWVKAFNFTILSDDTRPTGDRFIRCRSEDGLGVNISGARAGDEMGPANGGLHFGLEHFGLDSADIEADIKRLQEMGFSQSHSAINKERIIHQTWFFRRCPSSCLSQFIKRTNNKIFKSVTGIKIGFFINFKFFKFQLANFRENNSGSF